jgi:uncharacterized repeat protein (TIGR03803 family)
MTGLSAWKKNYAIFLLCAATTSVHGQTLTTLVNFDETNGSEPMHVSLAQGADGYLYGTTQFGGDPNCEFGQGLGGCGIVFRVTYTGVLTMLHEFEGTDGGVPEAGIILATDGSFYGTTSTGGFYGGTVFKITPDGALSTIYNFCVDGQNCLDGVNAQGPVVQGSDGDFYGTTSQDGGNNGGTVYKVTPQGILTTLHSFCADGNECLDGDFPTNALIQASDGNFYGTTAVGGANNEGTVYRLQANGTLTTLHSFCSQPDCSDGGKPEGGLVEGPDGSLYGTTFEGGTYHPQMCRRGGCGTIFRITRTGRFETIHGFTWTDGASPYDMEMIVGSDGNLYGTTGFGGANGVGTVFKLDPTGTLTTLYTFCSQSNCIDGQQPYNALVQATDGNFYGLTHEGGTSILGTVFQLSTGLGPFVAFVRGYGTVGQTGGILGQGFTGTTSVSFNGIPASFTVISDTFLKATVPAGATTGYVTVTTPSGTLTSNVPFHVIR